MTEVQVEPTRNYHEVEATYTFPCGHKQVRTFYKDAGVTGRIQQVGESLSCWTCRARERLAHCGATE